MLHKKATSSLTSTAGEYRLTSKDFREDINLTLNNVADIQRFNLEGQTALVLYGTYGAEQLKGYEIFSFNKKVTHTVLPANNRKYVFRSSVDRQNLIGAMTPFSENDSLFLAKIGKHEWPVKLENLPYEDRELLFPSHIAEQTSHIAPAPVTSIVPTRTASVTPPVNTYKSIRSVPPTLIRASVLTTLPRAVEKPQSNNGQKPVLRID